MANGLFYAYRNGILGAYTTTTWPDLNSDTIKCAFVDTGTYSATLTTDDYFNDASGYHPTGTYTTAGVAIGTPTIGTVAVGVFDAADTLFSSFSNGSVSVEAILMWKVGAADTSSPLIAWWDTTITGMPFTPSGGDVTISWNASGIFSF